MAIRERPRPLSILVVDDVADSRELYAAFFDQEGYRVAQARDGVDAIAAIATSKPDVVLMDLAMPCMSGWEATRQIKSDPRTNDIIVIVITGFDTDTELREALAAGADTVLTKPCTPDALRRFVSRLFTQASGELGAVVNDDREEVGAAVKNLEVGERVVVPLTISCGDCFFCKKSLFSCCDTLRASRVTTS